MNWRRELARHKERERVKLKQYNRRIDLRPFIGWTDTTQCTISFDCLKLDQTPQLIGFAGRYAQTIHAKVTSIDPETHTITGLVTSITMTEKPPCPTT